MTCESMRELFLTADLDELRGQGEGDLARHLRGCAACRADAGRILASTERFGAALSDRARRRVVAIVTPFALAAGVMLFVLTRPPAAPTSPVTSGPVQISTAVGVRSTAAPDPVSAVPIAGARPRSLATPAAVEATPVIAVAYAPPSPYAAELLRGNATEDHDLSGSRQPTVLHSSDPDITVLWFQ